MGAAERLPMIGPVTEARIQSAFAEAAVITAAAACKVIGCDPKTLREMTDAGIIRAVRVGAGKTRGYTEGDIRAYLTESDAPCPSEPPKRSRPATGRSNNVVPFTERRRRKELGRGSSKGAPP